MGGMILLLIVCTCVLDFVLIDFYFLDLQICAKVRSYEVKSIHSQFGQLPMHLLYLYGSVNHSCIIY